MSARATFWAWEQDLNASQKIVLLSLANFANDEDESWHGMASLSKATGMTRRSVINQIKYLQDNGYITVVRRKKEGSVLNDTNVYRINIDLSKTSTKHKKVVKEIHHPSERDSLPLMKEIHYPSERDSPKSKRESKSKSKNKNNASGDAWQESVWKEIQSHYKRASSRIGDKQKAIAILKKFDAEQISTIVKSIAQHADGVIRAQEIKPDRTLPHLTTWLNGKRFDQDASDFYPDNTKPVETIGKARFRAFGT